MPSQFQVDHQPLVLCRIRISHLQHRIPDFVRSHGRHGSHQRMQRLDMVESQCLLIPRLLERLAVLVQSTRFGARLLGSFGRRVLVLDDPLGTVLLSAVLAVFRNAVLGVGVDIGFGIVLLELVHRPVTVRIAIIDEFTFTLVRKYILLVKTIISSFIQFARSTIRPHNFRSSSLPSPMLLRLLPQLLFVRSLDNVRPEIRILCLVRLVLVQRFELSLLVVKDGSKDESFRRLFRSFFLPRFELGDQLVHRLVVVRRVLDFGTFDDRPGSV
jgi:hypothetical protein